MTGPRRLRLVTALPLLLLAGASAPAAAPRFDPLRFFSGATEGVGRFKVILRSARAVHVRGRGRVEGGTLILDQRVTREGAQPTTRQWRIRQVSPGRYTGTLTDARGPVTGQAQGNRLHLAYTDKGGYRIEQSLVLAPDGQSAQNRLVAKRFGITVATLDETIRRVPGSG